MSVPTSTKKKTWTIKSGTTFNQLKCYTERHSDISCCSEAWKLKAFLTEGAFYSKQFVHKPDFKESQATCKTSTETAKIKMYSTSLIPSSHYQCKFNRKRWILVRLKEKKNHTPLEFMHLLCSKETGNFLFKTSKFVVSEQFHVLKLLLKYIGIQYIQSGCSHRLNIIVSTFICSAVKEFIRFQIIGWWLKHRVECEVSFIDI